MRTRVALCAMVVASLGASLGASGAVAGGTEVLVRGFAVRGPVAPTCLEGRSCVAPLAGAVIAFSRDGREVARVVSDARGRFVLRLAPGRYGVRAPGRGPLARLSPGVVRIPVTGPVALRIDLDTGIRTPAPVRG